MTEQEAVLQIQAIPRKIWEQLSDSDNEAIEMAFKALEKQIDGGWIPCSSGQMPEDMEEVLVWFEYFRYGNYNRLCQRYGLSYTFKGEWSGFINGESGWHQWRIIAWQPLPAEYREGE